MGETALQDIIAFIDEGDAEGLKKALGEDNSEINQYYEMRVDEVSELAVRMTPLQFAVKAKNPACVQALLQYGSDTKMRLKTPENKSLKITALKLAEGERNVAINRDDVAEIKAYEEIVQLITDHVNAQKKESKKSKKLSGTDKILEAANTAPKPAGVDTSLPAVGTLTGTVSPPSLASPIEIHRVAQRATQNHHAILKMQKENEDLKKEVEELKQDVAMLKRLVLSAGSSNPHGSISKKGPSSSSPDSAKKRPKSMLMHTLESEEENPVEGDTVPKRRATATRPTTRNENTEKPRSSTKPNSKKATPRRDSTTSLPPVPEKKPKKSK